MHIPSGDDEKGTGLEEEFYGERAVFRLPAVQYRRKLYLDALNADLVFYVPNFERRLLRITQNLIQSGEDFYPFLSISGQFEYYRRAKILHTE